MNLKEQIAKDATSFELAFKSRNLARVLSSSYPWGWMYVDGVTQRLFRDWCNGTPGVHAELQAPLKAQPITLYPTFDSLKEVMDLAEAKLPIEYKNEVIAILAIYHNTLLNILK